MNQITPIQLRGYGAPHPNLFSLQAYDTLGNTSSVIEEIICNISSTMVDLRYFK